MGHEIKTKHKLLKDKKIAVVGIGGVGGYLAGMLGSHFPHVTFAARGGRLKCIREHGLILHSDYHGEMTVIPEKAVPVVQAKPVNWKRSAVILCTRLNGLEFLCRYPDGCMNS